MSKKLKVLVGVKRVIDASIKIRVRPDQLWVVTDNVKMTINPFDENAVEQAVRLKEKGFVSEIVSLSIGPQHSQEILRTSLALGADRGIHVAADENLEPLVVSKIFQKIIEKEKPDLVFLGKQAIDDDCGVTPQLLSSLLEWQQCTFASKFEMNQDGYSARVMREIDGGTETLEVKFPAIISCDLRLNTPRFANLPSIMKARKKKLDSIDIASLGIDISTRNQIRKVIEPPEREAGVMVKSVEELVEKLKMSDYFK